MEENILERWISVTENREYRQRGRSCLGPRDQIKQTRSMMFSIEGDELIGV